jgi:hypothetical protein
MTVYVLTKEKACDVAVWQRVYAVLGLVWWFVTIRVVSKPLLGRRCDRPELGWR